MKSSVSDPTLAAYLEDGLSPEARRQIEEELEQSPELAQRLEQLRSLREEVANLGRSESFEDPELIARVRAQLDAPPPARRGPTSLQLSSALVPVALAVGLLWWFGATTPERPAPVVAGLSPEIHDFGAEHPEFRARGGNSPVAPGPRLGLEVYQLNDARVPQRRHGTLEADRGVLVAYHNEANYEHLLVFAIDDERTIYWLYPDDREDSARSISVQATQGRAKELRDLIHHPELEGVIHLVAIYSHVPLSVASVQSALNELDGSALDTGRLERGQWLSARADGPHEVVAVALEVRPSGPT